MSGAEEGHVHSSGRRYAVVVGVSRHEEPFSDLSGTVEGAEHVADLLASMGYERVLPSVSVNPTSSELRQELSAWGRQARLGPDDVVVAYFGGHGALYQDRHYLIGADDGEDFPHTAIAGTDFVGMVANSLAGSVLVIIDTCYAGATASDAVRSLIELGCVPSAGSGNTWVLASATSTEMAMEGAMAKALGDVLTGMSAGKRQRYLSVERVAEGINRHFGTHGVPQRAVAAGRTMSGESPFFPNPAYISGLPRDSLDIPSVVRLRREPHDHFMSRSRGVPYASEPGDLFVGRLEALRAITDWLGTSGAEVRPLVVTGEPGSGKSALLGRVLALTDPDSTARLSVPPDVLPPPGLAAIAMNCRTVEHVVESLSASLDLHPSSFAGVHAALARRTDPVVIVLDGLDEALESDRIIAEVIAPLVGLSAVRLMVGIRRSLIASLGEDVHVIDLDTPKYSDDTDLRAYARLLLEGRASESGRGSSDRYRAHPARAAAEAESIAHEARGSFAMAQALTRAVLHGEVPGGDLSNLSSGDVDDLFRRYLDGYGPKRELAVRLLLPLAYAQGAGLPGRLWAPLAEALAGTSCKEAAVRWFLAQENTDALVAEGVTTDGQVYRLAQSDLMEHLQAPGEDSTVHRRLVEALLRQVPVSTTRERDWEAAPLYIREHLATHAAAGHVLDGLLQDDAYVRHAVSGPLLRALLETSAVMGTRSAGSSVLSGVASPQERIEQIASRILSDRVTVLVVATEWSSAHGGLSTFNRHLCLALVSAGAAVFCAVVAADDSEVADAAAKGVTLLCHPGAPGAPDYGKLTRRPRLPPGVDPDLIIGHARTTGPAAAHLQEDFFPRARRLHIVHMAPDEIEWHKPDGSTDRAHRAEERTDIERRLGASAHRVLAVGPRLYERFRNELCDEDGLEPLRIDPGFDLPAPRGLAARTPPPGKPFKVLMMGRTEDAMLKGVDLGARACGLVHELRTKASTEPIELVVRGAPPGMADMQQERIGAWSGVPGMDVVVRPYSTDPRRLDADMARASLVIMPSRREGFGLAGLEAIIRGVPLLVSANSGLALLLREFLGGDADPLIVPVIRDDPLDADTWAMRIEGCLSDREAAFGRMAVVRDALAARVTWAEAASRVLGEASLRHDSTTDVRGY
ncbi:caspase family protein [Streptomyces sp. ME02-6991-2A]|uniref:caspase family protein n=1 Tax=Streptomyces sp. ME02-6991-2A TaxID=3028677 RepID=UPI0029AA5AC5|nr:caspase family protein [Streptomyces sp. ME02-6991-2A]MDX3374674.1 caspase family protein [Streptomyces sp. ME02-6991-2A]